MSLKDIILEKGKETRCINCKYHEKLDTKYKPDYCSKHDKLILPMHLEVKRICEDFK